MTGFEVPDGLRSLAQWVDLVDHRPNLTGLDEFSEELQLLVVLPGDTAACAKVRLPGLCASLSS
jgi:hypothetical protein